MNEKLPGIRESELAKHGPCVICGEPLMSPGRLPMFYRVTLERAGFDNRAINRRVGLAMMLGSDTLAQVMGADEFIAKVFDGPATAVVHEECGMRIAHILELMPKKKKEDAA